jgi:glycosyltransferase involved in cell wall biosynthesis
MDIVYLSASVIPSTKANSIQVQKMCKAFTEIGHRVTLFATSSITDLSDKEHINLPFSYNLSPKIGPAPISSMIYGLRIGKQASQMKADIWYGRCPHSLFHVGRHGCPFIYEAHTLPQRSMRKWLENRLFKMQGFCRLVVISNSLRNAYLDMFSNLSDQQIMVAHDGAEIPDDIDDIDSYCAPKENQSDAPLEIGYVGSLYPGKGVEGVLDLAKMRPQHSYHIVGGSQKEVSKWATKGLSQVKFHGRVSQDSVHQMLRKFDILLLLPQFQVETAGGGNIAPYMSPLKMFEYMASGRPIIASSLAVIREVLVDHKNALLVSPNKLNEYANALDQLVLYPHLRFELAKSAYIDLENNYTWQKRGKLVLQ